MNPSVSIGMPAFNAEIFIGKAIESIQNQTLRNFELIVIDDGSLDKTWNIANHFRDTDKRIRVLRNTSNKGLVYTRNRCIHEATAPFFAWADADDVFHSRRIEKQIHYLNTHPEVGVLGGNVSFIDESDTDIREPSHLFSEDQDIRFFSILGPCIWNTVTIYRRDLLRKVEGYQGGYENGAEDYELWSRLLRITRFANLESHLASVRVHHSSVTSTDLPTKRNIFRIARGLLSEYLQFEIDPQTAEDIVLLFWHGLGNRSDISEALDLAQILKKTARRKEALGTYSHYCKALHTALWIQAQAQIYTNRRQSLRGTMQAFSLAPQLVGTPEFAKYAFRWAVPDRIRHLAKKLWAPKDRLDSTRS